jgi:predicted RNase H-like HicB family nuclease
MAEAVPLEHPSAARRAFIVRAHRDSETGGWWADSDDIPGLVTEAETFDALFERVRAVVPELCEANGIVIAGGDVLQVRRDRETPAMTADELERALSALGAQMWDAMLNDDDVSEKLYELTEAKLSIDGATKEDTTLMDDAARAIFEEGDLQSPNVLRPKAFVASGEWAKNALYNLTLRWVLDQSLARMLAEKKFPSEIGKHSP